MKLLIRSILFLFFISQISNILAQSSEDDGIDNRSPFSKVIYKDNHPFIEVDQEWVKIISIQDQSIQKIIRQCVDLCPKDWKTCFHEFWGYIMDDLGVERKENISIRYLQNGIESSHSFQLLEENTKLAKDFHYQNITSNRINRKRTQEIPSEFKYLVKRLDGFQKMDTDWISKEEAIHDLNYLEWEIANHYSYADLRGFDYQGAIDAIILNLRDGISKRDFAYQLKMLMTNFGDGHSRVSFRDIKKPEESIWLPFEIIKHEDNFYAVDGETKSFLYEDFPQIIAINDHPIDHLFELAKELVSKSNKKSMTKDALVYFNYTGFILKLTGEKNLKNAQVTFSDGQNHKTKSFVLGKHRLQKLIKDHQLMDTILPKGIGYIALNTRMYKTDEFIEGIHQAMQNVKKTEGLIIDIRRNGGGNRAPLINFLSYFIKEPKVVNVAKFRIDQADDLDPQFGYLDSRYLFPFDIKEDYFLVEDEFFSIKDFKNTISTFQKSFTPARLAEEDKFSVYHYMVVNPKDLKNRYYYDQEVIILIDEGCFSASDIFAAGMKQGDQVQLLGNCTQGGSGNAKSKYLPNSEIKVKLSRIFSYQPDGNLYDTHGVVPDIQVDYTLEDKLGNSDSQLDAAIQLLQRHQ